MPRGFRQVSFVSLFGLAVKPVLSWLTISEWNNLTPDVAQAPFVEAFKALV